MAIRIEIRPVRDEDIPGMLEIYRPIVESTSISFELEPPTVDEMAQRIAATQETDNHWLVAKAGRDVAGYAYSSPYRGRAAYRHSRETTVYVAEERRNEGIASSLMSALLEQLSASGVHLAIAGITLPNPASVALHESLGYTHVGTFSEAGHKFGRWHDVGFWQRLLS